MIIAKYFDRLVQITDVWTREVDGRKVASIELLTGPKFENYSDGGLVESTTAQVQAHLLTEVRSTGEDYDDVEDWRKDQPLMEKLFPPQLDDENPGIPI